MVTVNVRFSKCMDKTTYKLNWDHLEKGNAVNRNKKDGEEDRGREERVVRD